MLQRGHMSVSNTGLTITLCASPETVEMLNERFGTEKPDKFGIEYEDGTIYIRPAGKARFSRTFLSNGTVHFMVLKPKQIPDFPLTGKLVLPLTFEQGQATLRLPTKSELPAPKPNAIKLKKPINDRIGGKNGFAGWKSEEARLRSIEGLKKAREARIKKAEQRRLKKARQIAAAAEQPAPRFEGQANIAITVGTKVLTFDVPTDELFDVALGLTERGYRVKENT